MFAKLVMLLTSNDTAIFALLAPAPTAVIFKLVNDNPAMSESNTAAVLAAELVVNVVLTLAIDNSPATTFNLADSVVYPVPAFAMLIAASVPFDANAADAVACCLGEFIGADISIVGASKYVCAVSIIFTRSIVPVVSSGKANVIN